MLIAIAARALWWAWLLTLWMWLDEIEERWCRIWAGWAVSS